MWVFRWGIIIQDWHRDLKNELEEKAIINDISFFQCSNAKIRM